MLISLTGWQCDGKKSKLHYVTYQTIPEIMFNHVKN